VYILLSIFVLIYHSITFKNTGKVYQLNESMKKINKIVKIGEFHNTINVKGDLELITSPTMLIQVSNLLFEQFSTPTILNANKDLSGSAINQFRVLDQHGCHDVSILSPFDYNDDSGVSIDTECTTCSLICNSYYSRTKTRSLKPYYDHKEPFIVTQESEVNRINGRFATYDKDAFQATQDIIRLSSDVYTDTAFGNTSDFNLNDNETRAYAVLSGWIDEKTRALSMSTVFYNMNVDMMVGLTTLWEFTLVGHWETTVRAESSYLYYEVDAADAVLLFFISVLVLCVMYVKFTKFKLDNISLSDPFFYLSLSLSIPTTSPTHTHTHSNQVHRHKSTNCNSCGTL